MRSVCSILLFDAFGIDDRLRAAAQLADAAGRIPAGAGAAAGGDFRFVLVEDALHVIGKAIHVIIS